MTIINRIYGRYVLNKYKEEFEKFEDLALPIINEEIVKLQSKIVDEVMNSNNPTKIRAYKNTVLELRELSEIITEDPLELSVDLFAGIGDGELIEELTVLENKISTQEIS